MRGEGAGCLWVEVGAGEGLKGADARTPGLLARHCNNGKLRDACFFSIAPNPPPFPPHAGTAGILRQLMAIGELVVGMLYNV